jgi:hypothetical protein
MFAAALALAVGLTGNSPAAVGVSHPPVTPGSVGAALPASAPVHLGISLRAPSIEAMRSRLVAQQDPNSPTFRRWLSAADFGKEFGLADADYTRVKGWLTTAGFQVTAFDDHLFIEAFGTHAMVQKLLGVVLHSLLAPDGHVYRTYQGTPQAPGDVAPLVLNISGLDTQLRFHPLLLDTQGDQVFGPQDLRRFYDLQPLLDLGYTGRGAQLVVLGVATDSTHAPRNDDIQFFFDNYADTRASLLTRTLPNPNGDVDSTAAARTEMELDVEVQAIAAPGATSILMEFPPASEQLSTGAHDVATLTGVTAVSTSFGTCEANTTQDEAQSIEQLVLLGTLAGQTWVAAAGDNGADDCGTGTGPAVDLPADVPEMVAAGGTAVKSPTFDANHAVAEYAQEITWNQSGIGAGGGGHSVLFTQPSWQATTVPGDQTRDLPDIALFAAPVPGVAIDGQQPARTTAMGGTSVAAPLAAGMFAVLADRLGCQLGGINPSLYAVGVAQAGGGSAAFHDIVAGNNTFNGVAGQSAGVGFDLATGWGSIDVVALANALPACPLDAGTPDAGPLVPYDSCEAIVCVPGSTCDTDPEGPSYCFTPCDPLDGGACAAGNICVGDDGGGHCILGCLSDADCADGDSCDSCSQSCEPAGNSSALVGDACRQDSDCPVGGMCLTDATFAGGYCTRYCDSCACSSGSTCLPLNEDVCLAQCASNADCRSGYACQPVATNAGPVGACLPHCQSDADCTGLDPGTHCDLPSGTCLAYMPNDGGMGTGHGGGGGTGGGSPLPSPDAGQSGTGGGEAVDAGSVGEVTAPTSGGSGGGVSQGVLRSGGCSQGGDAELPVLAVLALVELAFRRRSRLS